MTSDERPEAQPTRRIFGDGAADATRRLDEGGVPPADRTRRLDEPGAAHGTDDEHVPYAGVPPADPIDAGAPADDEGPGEPSRAGRDAIVGLAGLLIGVVLAFVIVALGTRTPDAGTEVTDPAALEERIAELEAQVAEREARVAQLEAQLADEDVAADEQAADLAAQRQAQEERSAALDARAQALDEREEALDRRAAAQPPAAEPPAADPAPGADPGPGQQPADEPPGGGLPSLPDFDAEQAETIVERVLEQIRELFQR